MYKSGNCAEKNTSNAARGGVVATCGRHSRIYESGGWVSAEDDDEIEKSETIGIAFIARRSDKACGDGATGGKASHDDNGSAELHW